MKLLINILILTFLISGCSSQPVVAPSRDLANFLDSCSSIVSNLLKKESAASAFNDLNLPELKTLNSTPKQFPNGKKYIEYLADLRVMKNNAEYNEFLRHTAEIIFEPAEPFGHIRLRIANKTFSFSNIQYTSVHNFSPRVFPISADEKKMPNARGFVFYIGAENAFKYLKQIERFYESSNDFNIPPFDAYSPLLKIEKADGLKFNSNSPKLANKNAILGKIVSENNSHFLVAKNGFKFEIEKKGDDYFAQSFSCSSSAAFVLNKFFNIQLTSQDGAKSLNDALLRGNPSGNLTPFAIIQYAKND